MCTQTHINPHTDICVVYIVLALDYNIKEFNTVGGFFVCFIFAGPYATRYIEKF